MIGENVAAAWLARKLQTFPTLTALIGSGTDMKAFDQGAVPEDVTPPYLTVYQRLLTIAQPLGTGLPVTAETAAFDLSLWALGTDSDVLRPALSEINAALEDMAGEVFVDDDATVYQVSSAVVGRVPVAPPPKDAGDPRMVRMGRVYEIFVGTT